MTLDTTSVWESDEDPPWAYMIGKRHALVKFRSKLKEVAEDNRDPLVAATMERLFIGGLPSHKTRAEDKKVAYERVDSYYPKWMTQSRPSGSQARIRFNPSVYIHGDAIDEGEAYGPGSVIMVRSTPLKASAKYPGGRRPAARNAPSPPTFDIYKPNLGVLAPGSFRVPIADNIRMEQQKVTRIRSQIVVSGHLRAPSERRRIPKRIADIRMNVRLYEEACVLHEVVQAQAFADTILDTRPDWGAMMGRSIEEALAKTGWDRRSLRSGVKAPPPTQRKFGTVAKYVRPI